MLDEYTRRGAVHDPGRRPGWQLRGQPGNRADAERRTLPAAGDVYVIDANNKQVVKLAAGSNDQTVLPFTGLNYPDDVAVDAAGNVYVLDNSGFGRVVKLAAS